MSIRPDLPLGEFARAQALERLSAVSDEMRRARRDPDADAVHDLRVAIRRFLSVLEVFPECFSANRAAKGVKRLKRALTAAGEVRDRDIALALAARPESGESSGLCERLMEERQRSAARLRNTLKKKRRREVLETGRRAVRPKKSGGAAEEADGWRPAAAANENAIERLPGLIWELFEAGRQALYEPVDSAELHALRLMTKRRRYTLELFAPCYDAELAERLRQLQYLQHLLGEINDRRASKDLAESGDMEAYLEHERRRLTEEFARYWHEVFDAPGECEGWMLELARLSSAKAFAATR